MAGIANKRPSTKLALPDNKFTEIASLNLDSMLETKNNFKYVSWPHAVKILKSYYPDARILVTKFPDERGNLVLPYLPTPQGFFVEVTVYKDREDPGQPLMQPILDFKNKSVANPDTFQINTSIMRTKAKAVAIAIGAGLYVYAGEDLPTDSAVIVTEGDRVEQLMMAKREAQKRELLQVISKIGSPLGWDGDSLKKLVKQKYKADSGLALEIEQLQAILELVGKEGPNASLASART